MKLPSTRCPSLNCQELGTVGHHLLLFLELQMPVNQFVVLEKFLDFSDNTNVANNK